MTARPEPEEREYEQRHFNRRTEKWSEWYPSSEGAYHENLFGGVDFYEVRIARPAPTDEPRE